MLGGRDLEQEREREKSTYPRAMATTAEQDSDERAAIRLLHRLLEAGEIELVSSHGVASLAPTIGRVLAGYEPSIDRARTLSNWLIEQDEVADLYIDDPALEALLCAIWDPRPRPRRPVVARREDLEALLRLEPDNLDHQLVYGDWLQTQVQRDPWAELIARRVAATLAPDDAGLAEAVVDYEREHGEALWGRLAEYIGVVVRLEWYGGFIVAAKLGKPASDPEPYEGAILLGWLLDQRATLLLRDVELGRFDHHYARDQHSELVTVVLAQPRPMLRRLVITHSRDAGDAGRLDELAERLPNLEVLELRIRSARAHDLSHPTLRRLVWDAAIGPEQAATFARAVFPKLEQLCFANGWSREVLGSGQTLGSALAKIEAPALRSLRFRGPGESLAAIARAPWFEQLEHLDLSDGQIHDHDLAPLLDRRWPNLRELDLSRNHLEADGITALTRRYPNVVIGRQRPAGDDDPDDVDDADAPDQGDEPDDEFYASVRE